MKTKKKVPGSHTAIKKMSLRGGRRVLRRSTKQSAAHETRIASPAKGQRSRNDVGIKSVIFDLGNVLLNFDAKRAATRFAKACKVSETKVWDHFFTSPTEKAYTRGEISCKEFYEHAKESLKVPVSFEKFKHFWNDIFWENKGMDELLEKLAKQYPLYLISNTNKMHFDYILKEFDILRHFKKTFPSHEVGHRKPEPQIYKKVLKAIKLKAKETVFVDDVQKFVDGALAVGMNAIQFKNKPQLVRELKKIGVTV